MDNFDLKKYLDEGKLKEDLSDSPEIKFEKALQDLETLSPSFSEYPEFEEGLTKLTNAYNEYMNYEDETPGSI